MQPASNTAAPASKPRVQVQAFISDELADELDARCLDLATRAGKQIGRGIAQLGKRKVTLVSSTFARFALNWYFGQSAKTRMGLGIAQGVAGRCRLIQVKLSEDDKVLVHETARKMAMSLSVDDPFVRVGPHDILRTAIVECLRSRAMDDAIVDAIVHDFESNGPCRDRTCDLGIKNPLLYQLS